jgi:ATP sulfurylase
MIPTDESVPAHGGLLVDLIVDRDRAADLRATSLSWPSWTLTPRQLCDFELLANGALSPLTGFMTRADYESVCDAMRLSNGTLWPIPITLDVREEVAARLSAGDRLALRGADGALLGALHVKEVWAADANREAMRVFGTRERLLTQVKRGSTRLVSRAASGQRVLTPRCRGRTIETTFRQRVPILLNSSDLDSADMYALLGTDRSPSES